MRDGRWETVTDSQFDHERSGLASIKNALPDGGVWRAWSNFTFTAHTGHVREVDLLILAPGGLYLVELKDWHGSVISSGSTWLQTQPSGRQIAHRNPLHLANQKAKELASLLGQALSRMPGHGLRAPWVQEAVCFTDPSLRVRLSQQDHAGVFGLGTGRPLPDLIEYVSRPPRSDRFRVDAALSNALPAALKAIGIDRSDAEFTVGPYKLDRRPFDTGPTWADYLGHHTALPEVRRVRIYLRESGSDRSLRDSIERAAQREAAVLTGFKHPGIVRLVQFNPSGHSAGPALIYEYDQRTLRLDEYLAQYGEKLDILSRIALVRQLAETLRSAHGRRLYHRTLSARAVHVFPARRGRRSARGDGVGEESAWLTPQLQLSDWQVALRLGGGGQSTWPTGEQVGTPPSSMTHVGRHLAAASDPYLAPELTVPDADPLALDVYGLGLLTYLLLTGQAPASSQAELLVRLEAGEGLRPSAVVDGLSELTDDLVQEATAYDPRRRVATVAEFLETLELVEEELTAPAEPRPPAPPGEPPTPDGTAGQDGEQPDEDPLEAAVGDVLADRWQIERRLGTGSTSRAFLARDLRVEDERASNAFVVLKVALSDSRGAVLRREAEIMARLRPDSRIIRLVEPEPVVIGGRTVLVLEYVGDRTADGRAREFTVARQLRENGRLSVDRLEPYGDYLFGAVDFLEGEGVWHRDLKPDNIAVRVRPNGTRELVLIDFSLAGYPASETSAGTEGYLDPFLGTIQRHNYDAHAERYALAATLHEMASRELPAWGGRRVAARQTDPALEPHAKLAAEAFDPAVRAGLTEFFARALHRDHTKRFPHLKAMRDAWKRIFLDMEETRPSKSRHSQHGRVPVGAGTDAGRITGSDDAPLGVVEPESAAQEREQAAAAATRDTPIELSGLSPAAVSFVYGLEVATVGALVDLSQRTLINQPGLGSKTRTEIQQRIKQWRQRFGRAEESPLTTVGRDDARNELSALESEATDALGTAVQGAALTEQSLRRVSLDALATIFVPALRPDGKNRSAVDTTRLLLRLPDEKGALPQLPPWPTQSRVAEQVGLTRGRIPQIVTDQRKRWAKHPAVQVLRSELLELLRDLGRAASAVELADRLALRRGTRLSDPVARRALALAAVRAVVEVEQLAAEGKAFADRRHSDPEDESRVTVLLALEVGEDDGPDTASAPALLDYADRLGKVADKLAAQNTLPPAATVLADLGLVAPPNGVLDLDERRVVALAAAASFNAADSTRMEIYPRDLSVERALRLTQAGLVGWVAGVEADSQPGLTEDKIHERIRARFPELRSLPTGDRLTAELKLAGFDLVVRTDQVTRRLRYLPRASESLSSSGPATSVSRRRSGRTGLTRWVENADEAAAVQAEEQLQGSRGRDGFRVLTVSVGRAVAARTELAQRFGARPVSVAGLFVGSLHELVDVRQRPTWETILKADVAAPGSQAAINFAEYVATAWSRVEPKLTALVETATQGSDTSGDTPKVERGSGLIATNLDDPLLLDDGSVFARYNAMGVLHRVAEHARSGGRPVWLLCPQQDPTRDPRFGATIVPFQRGFGEWIVLPDTWVRGGFGASGGAAVRATAASATTRDGAGT
jgi:serine/threonine protein kinase